MYAGEVKNAKELQQQNPVDKLRKEAGELLTHPEKGPEFVKNLKEILGSNPEIKAAFEDTINTDTISNLSDPQNVILLKTYACVYDGKTPAELGGINGKLSPNMFGSITKSLKDGFSGNIDGFIKGYEGKTGKKLEGVDKDKISGQLENMISSVLSDPNISDTIKQKFLHDVSKGFDKMISVSQEDINTLRSKRESSKFLDENGQSDGFYATMLIESNLLKSVDLKASLISRIHEETVNLPGGERDYHKGNLDSFNGRVKELDGKYGLNFIGVFTNGKNMENFMKSGNVSGNGLLFQVIQAYVGKENPHLSALRFPGMKAERLQVNQFMDSLEGINITIKGKEVNLSQLLNDYSSALKDFKIGQIDNFEQPKAKLNNDNDKLSNGQIIMGGIEDIFGMDKVPEMEAIERKFSQKLEMQTDQSLFHTMSEFSKMIPVFGDAYSAYHNVYDLKDGMNLDGQKLSVLESSFSLGMDALGILGVGALFNKLSKSEKFAKAMNSLRKCLAELDKRLAAGTMVMKPEVKEFFMNIPIIKDIIAKYENVSQKVETTVKTVNDNVQVANQNVLQQELQVANGSTVSHSVEGGHTGGKPTSGGVEGPPSEKLSSGGTTNSEGTKLVVDNTDHNILNMPIAEFKEKYAEIISNTESILKRKLNDKEIQMLKPELLEVPPFAGRLNHAQDYLREKGLLEGSVLTEQQKNAIIKAHCYGISTELVYTQGEKNAKALMLMREGGFDRNQTLALTEVHSLNGKPYAICGFMDKIAPEKVVYENGTVVNVPGGKGKIVGVDKEGNYALDMGQGKIGKYSQDHLDQLNAPSFSSEVPFTDISKINNPSEVALEITKIKNPEVSGFLNGLKIEDISGADHLRREQFKAKFEEMLARVQDPKEKEHIRALFDKKINILLENDIVDTAINNLNNMYNFDPKVIGPMLKDLKLEGIDITTFPQFKEFEKKLFGDRKQILADAINGFKAIEELKLDKLSSEIGKLTDIVQGLEKLTGSLPSFKSFADFKSAFQHLQIPDGNLKAVFLSPANLPPHPSGKQFNDIEQYLKAMSMDSKVTSDPYLRDQIGKLSSIYYKLIGGGKLNDTLKRAEDAKKMFEVGTNLEKYGDKIDMIRKNTEEVQGLLKTLKTTKNSEESNSIFSRITELKDSVAALNSEVVEFVASKPDLLRNKLLNDMFALLGRRTAAEGKPDRISADFNEAKRIMESRNTQRVPETKTIKNLGNDVWEKVESQIFAGGPAGIKLDLKALAGADYKLLFTEMEKSGLFNDDCMPKIKGILESGQSVVIKKEENVKIIQDFFTNLKKKSGLA